MSSATNGDSHENPSEHKDDPWRGLNLKGKIVLVDVDDVIRQTNLHCIGLYREIKNPSFDKTFEQITDWDLRAFYEDESACELLFIQHAKRVFREPPPMEGALQALNKMIELGARIYFCTNQFLGNERHTLVWLANHGFTNRAGIFFGPDKHIVQGGDVLIDDHITNLQNCDKVGMQTICFDRPWNKSYQGKRAMDWKDLPNVLRTIPKFCVTTTPYFL